MKINTKEKTITLTFKEVDLLVIGDLTVEDLDDAIKETSKKSRIK